MRYQSLKLCQENRNLRWLVFLAISAYGSLVQAVTLTYTDRGTFEAAVASRQTIDFSSNNNGLPLTFPSTHTYMDSWTRSGVTFYSFDSLWNQRIQSVGGSKLTVTLPANTKAFGADLSMIGGSPSGTYVIALPDDTMLTAQTTLPFATQFFGLVSDDPIDWVEFSFDSDVVTPDVLVMDNFTFQSSCVARPSGLNGWWPLDETTGFQSRDISGNNNHGNWVGTAESIPAKVFGGMAFGDISGANGVTIPNSPSVNLGTGDFSMAFWLRPTEEDTWDFKNLIDKYSAAYEGFSVVLYQGAPYFVARNATSSFTLVNFTPKIPADGRWHFFVVTINRLGPSGGKFYLDGVQSGPAMSLSGMAGQSFTSTAPLTVGYSTVELPVLRSFAGGIDELMIFNRVLSPSEIQQLYSAPVGVCR